MTDGQTRITVLVVEDNPYDARIIKELFRDMNDDSFALKFAETMQAAGGFASPAPSVVLLDLNLPDSNGAETLPRAEGLFPDVPVIVLTGFYEERLGLEMIKSGAQDYLVKGKITGEWLRYAIQYAIERGRNERQLKRREQHLRDILEKSPDGYIIVRPDRKVLFANRGAETILASPAKELLSRPFTLESDTGKVLETELACPGGERMPVEIRAVELNWEGEECRLVILRDLTPVRELERHRDEFISSISHELRSPLTVVRESLGLVFDETLGEVNERQKEVLKMGVDNVGRMNRLIDGLLDITKIEAGVMPVDISLTDLGALVSETAAEYAYVAAERKIKLQKELTEGPLATYCDREKIREVLVNLVSNALKFSPEGGTIKLSLKAWEGGALFCVEDQGPGVDAEDIPRLFNKFAQLGHRRPQGIKGTGLGLAISRGIVQLHGGKIWLESRADAGSRFYIQLPLKSFEAALKEAVRREIELSSPGKRGFCVVTLNLAGRAEAGTPAEALLEKAEQFIKRNMNNSHAVIRNTDGEFTLLLSDSGPNEGIKASSFIEKGLAKIGMTNASGRKEITTMLSFPGDFCDETTMLEALAKAREKVHA